MAVSLAFKHEFYDHLNQYSDSQEVQYLGLLFDILNKGKKKSIFSSNGKTLGTIDKNRYTEVDKDSKYLLSQYGSILRFNLENDVIPLYTTKSVWYPGAFKEMLWFIKGKGDVAALNQQGVQIWNGWAYKHFKAKMQELEDILGETDETSYECFVEEYLSADADGNLSEYPIEVPYTDMTSWDAVKALRMISDDEVGGELIQINQTKWLIDQIKKNPDRKSYVVSAWNPPRLYQMAKETEQESVALAACHAFHQVVVNEDKLTLGVFIRSNDCFLGNSFNVAQYALLARMYSLCTGFPAEELVVFIGDAHIYSDHIDQVKQQILNPMNPFPTLKIKDRGQKYLEDFEYSDFSVQGYYSQESIKAPLTVVGGF